MSEIMTAVCAAGTYEKDGVKKTRWLKVGVAFPSKNSPGGYDLRLDAVPNPKVFKDRDGNMRSSIDIMLRPQDDGPKTGGTSAPGGDDIPF